MESRYTYTNRSSQYQPQAQEGNWNKRKCRHCGTDIDEKDYICPQCGYKQKTSKLAIAGIIAIGILNIAFVILYISIVIFGIIIGSLNPEFESDTPPEYRQTFEYDTVELRQTEAKEFRWE